MRKRKKMGLLAIAATVFAGAGTVAQADVIIDDFSIGGGQAVSVVDYSDDGLFSDDDDTVNGAAFNTSSTIGGYRELYVYLAPEGDSVSLTVAGRAAFEGYDPTSAPGPIDPSIAHITWDGTAGANFDADPALGLNANLSLENVFFFDTTNLTTANRQISIDIWDTDGDSSTAEYTILANTTQQYVSFTEFLNPAINWNSIGAIRLNFLTDDVKIFNIAAINDPNYPPLAPVPVPAAAGLGFLGMGLIAAFRRKQGAKVA